MKSVIWNLYDLFRFILYLLKNPWSRVHPIYEQLIQKQHAKVIWRNKEEIISYCLFSYSIRLKKFMINEHRFVLFLLSNLLLTENIISNNASMFFHIIIIIQFLIILCVCVRIIFASHLPLLLLSSDHHHP